LEYSITADRAILDLASKHREEFLLNIYRMGKRSIARGNQDHWTIVPKSIEDLHDKIEADKAKTEGSGRSRGFPLKYYKMLHDPAERDPRGYILPADQTDFLTATKFANTLIKNGIIVHQANRDFEVAGKSYPSGSYIIKCTQAFRPHILSMFEPQNYPDNIPCPGEPPVPTYDMAGWTLAFQMGVCFDRILEGFDGPFEKIADMAQTPQGSLTNPASSSGFLLDHRVNDAFIATNRLLQNGRSDPLKPEDVPEEYRDRLGNVTADKTVPQLLQFLKEGGTVLTIGSSTSLGFHAGLPIKNALVEKTQDGTEKPLSRAQIFIPGSLLQVRVDTSHPLAYGMGETADVVFNRSSVFMLQPEAHLKGIRPIAWFDSNTPLRSGWAWGQHYLEGGVVLTEATVGKGKLVMYGPDTLRRRNVIRTGPITAVHPFLMDRAIKKMPHQRVASPK